MFDQFGSATAPGTWISNSDERLKTQIERIAEPLDKMKMIRGVSWKRLDGVSPGIGFIAQEVQSVFPDNVFVTGNRELDDGTVIKDVLSPDTAGVAAALHHEAILTLMAQIDALTARVAELEQKNLA
ncbi:tail fiber domain-containing protein [Phytobacter diazotrophicus]|nr:tail fiber domain-containing protein [Phytobacter diazotrophicus]